MLIRAYLVSGEFRVHRADCRDCTREARRSDSSGAPEEFPSKAAVIRSRGPTSSPKTPASTAPRTAWPAWKPTPSSCPAPAGCPVSDPAAGSPRGGSAGPAPPGTAAGGPRADGDGIAVDIATGPAWSRCSSPGAATRGPARQPGRRSPTEAASTPAACSFPAPAGTATPASGCPCTLREAPPGGASPDDSGSGGRRRACIRAHPEILDLAAQARTRAGQARAVRDLELLTVEITAAEQHLAGLRRKEQQLTEITRNDRPSTGAGTKKGKDEWTSA